MVLQACHVAAPSTSLQSNAKRVCKREKEKENLD